MLIVLLIVLCLLIVYVVAGKSGAPWVPAKVQHINEMLNDAGLRKGAVFIELGCGDGRFLKAAADRGANAIGYELHPLLWLIAWLRTLSRRQKVRVILANFWSADISKADVVCTFLVPQTMPRLADKAQEMKKGARLLSYTFPLPGSKPTKRGKQWFVYTR